MDRRLIPDPQGMEETIRHMPVLKVRAAINSGWWKVEVQVMPWPRLSTRR